MLAQLMGTLSSLFHLIGAIAMFCGVLFLLASLLGGKGPDGYIKGILLILLAGWIGHMGV